MQPDKSNIKMQPFETYLLRTAGISIDEVMLLSSELKRVSFLKGKLLLNKGAVCKHSFFVEKGLLRSYMLDESGSLLIGAVCILMTLQKVILKQLKIPK